LRAEPGPESGIERFIGEYVEHVGRRAGIDARSEIADLADLPAELTRQVWNIVREAILNAERHARARTLRVSVAVENDALEVRVVDDGRGFEPDVERMGSFGIAGMRERAALLGAGLAIESSANGTTVRLTVPWPERSDDRR
ncbi:MAG: sensor histidine kinase, partial [Ilumatobacteraceae bacterium]